MKKALSLIATALIIVGCSSTQPEPKAVAAAATPDFSDMSSVALTVNAWNALGEGQYDLAIEYTDKCAELYETQARKMQASLSSKAPQDKVHDYWALNDVGTSYFIKGEALTKLRKYPEAMAAYKVVRDELKYAQTWDPKGWFWSPGEVAYAKVDWLKLQIDEDF